MECPNFYHGVVFTIQKSTTFVNITLSLNPTVCRCHNHHITPLQVSCQSERICVVVFGLMICNRGGPVWWYLHLQEA
ncbi:hypothetical protein ABEB36_015214 [Hypothenemus hampei]|uniref:Uncharacterized protein n=1 Tax=Hypothenemus hampei TaxID=57062 RepID=A0ABD1E1Q2_HYPHA